MRVSKAQGVSPSSFERGAGAGTIMGKVGFKFFGLRVRQISADIFELHCVSEWSFQYFVTIGDYSGFNKYRQPTKSVGYFT